MVKKRWNIINGEYNGMIENMETDIARNFIDNVVTNDSHIGRISLVGGMVFHVYRCRIYDNIVGKYLCNIKSFSDTSS